MDEEGKETAQKKPIGGNTPNSSSSPSPLLDSSFCPGGAGFEEDKVTVDSSCPAHSEMVNQLKQTEDRGEQEDAMTSSPLLPEGWNVSRDHTRASIIVF